jgi:Sulfotransferase domain
VTLSVVGAGWPRTGTHSLSVALERLLERPCYHMDEVFTHLEHVPVWRAALRGRPPEWNTFLADYSAAVDWPASAFWRGLADANPDAVVLLSVRDDAATWWRSADATVLEVGRKSELPEYRDWLPFFHELLRARIGEGWDNAETAMAAYESHVASVRAAAPPDRLVEWRPQDGWPPICSALGLPVPPEPFPHTNTTAEWASAEAPA